MGNYHKINIIKMNKVSEMLLLSSNNSFKKVIVSGKHLKCVKVFFLLVWSLFFSIVITVEHFFFNMCLETFCL